MAQFEYDDLFHPEVFLHEIHPLRFLNILKRIRMVAVQAIHHISLEVLQQVHLALNILRIVRHRVTLADIDRTLSPRCYVIKVTGRDGQRHA